jgi:thiol-disulfide isomerase/thioredoxin
MRWAAVVVAAACGGAPAKPAPGPVENHVEAPKPVVSECSGLCLPSVKYVDTKGHDHAVAGKRVIVTFWATWCRPCMEQLEQLALVAKGSDLVVLTVLANDNASDSDLEQLTQLPVIRATPELLAAFDYPAALPGTYVYSRTGAQLFKHIGLLSLRALTDVVPE